VKRLGLLIALCLFLMPATGMGDTFDFNIANGAPGAWSWAGGTSTLTASSGVYDQSSCGGYGCPNVQLVVNGTNLAPDNWLGGSNFTFTTGTGGGSWSYDSILNENIFTFGSGGSVTVTDDTYGDCGGNCFTGYFTTAQAIFNAGGNSIQFQGAFVSGDLSPDLIAALVYWQNQYLTNANNICTDNAALCALYTSLSINPNDPNSVVGNLFVTLAVGDGVTINQETGGCFDANGAQVNCGTFDSGELKMSTVPEPGTLMLFGTGLLSMAGFLRRRLLS
jgi:PEP-CTERM motif